MKPRNQLKSVKVVRWIARIASGLAAGVILLFFIGEGLSEGRAPLAQLSTRESTLMVAFALVWLGLVAGWRWELLGGLLTIVGLGTFYLLDYAFSGTFPRGPYFFLLASPSLLFLACGLWARRVEAAGQGPGRDSVPTS